MRAISKSSNQSGAALAEYAVLLMALGVMAFAAIQSAGNQVSASFDEVSLLILENSGEDTGGNQARGSSESNQPVGGNRGYFGCSGNSGDTDSRGGETVGIVLACGEPVETIDP